MSRPPTPLLLWLRTLVDVLKDARADIDEAAWSWFIAILAEVVGIELGKLLVEEGIRATRGEAA